jgi:5-(carboxyamino)imidazole ribonucleotide synthase
MDHRTGLPVVGMVGGGQLARMTHQAAIALGQSLRVLAVAPTTAPRSSPPTPTRQHTDLDALRRFAKGCDVVTFDHEHVPGDQIRALQATARRSSERRRAALRPGQGGHARAASELGAPVPRWRRVAPRPRWPRSPTRSVAGR